MEQLFAIELNKNLKLSVIGIVDSFNNKIKYQGLLNNKPFTEGLNYEKIRSRVMKAVEINSPKSNPNLF